MSWYYITRNDGHNVDKTIILNLKYDSKYFSSENLDQMSLVLKPYFFITILFKLKAKINFILNLLYFENFLTIYNKVCSYIRIMFHIHKQTEWQINKIWSLKRPKVKNILCCFNNMQFWWSNTCTELNAGTILKSRIEKAKV